MGAAEGRGQEMLFCEVRHFIQTGPPTPAGGRPEEAPGLAGVWSSPL